jgi:hypothetical protein
MSFSMFSRIALLHARWQISVMSAPAGKQPGTLSRSPSPAKGLWVRADSDVCAPEKPCVKRVSSSKSTSGAICSSGVEGAKSIQRQPCVEVGVYLPMEYSRQCR